jgi:translation initiation factor 4G
MALNESSYINEEVFREVRNILNKLTRQNFVKLTGDLINLPINNEDRLKGLVEIIYEDSINSEIYTEIYANICKVRNLVF